MPNYAYTSHHISGDEKEIKMLYDMMNKVINHPDAFIRDAEYYGRMSFRHFLEELCEEVPAIDLRGQICHFELDSEKALWISTESAWRAPFELHNLIRHRFPSLKILYFTDPDDDGVMETNDVNGEVFRTRYGIATEYMDEEFFDTIAEACQWAKHNLGIEANNLTELRNALLDYEEENNTYASLHKCLLDMD